MPPLAARGPPAFPGAPDVSGASTVVGPTVCFPDPGGLLAAPAPVSNHLEVADAASASHSNPVASAEMNPLQRGRNSSPKATPAFSIAKESRAWASLYLSRLAMSFAVGT